MTTMADSFKEQFLKNIALEYEKNLLPDQLQKVKVKWWDHFQTLGLPSRSLEVYNYIKLSKLYAQVFNNVHKLAAGKEEIARHIPSGCESNYLVCINGHFHPELSSIQTLSNKVVALPMQQAMQTYGTFLNNHLSKTLKIETDPFVVLNGALQQNGTFVYLPPKTVAEQPLLILNLIDTKDTPALLTPKMHVFLSKQSQIKLWVINKHLSGDSYLSNQSIDLSLEEGAVADLQQFTVGLPKSSWVFDGVRAVLKRDSIFRSVAVTNGSATVRQDYRIELTGENAEASLSGLCMLRESREAHTNILMDHQAPHCRSMQLFKGVLTDSSASSFEGKIFVRQPAQKTDAFQLNNNLLLSDKAKADSKPNLEIFADDVKASHGATVGQLDSEQLFYLRARGYSSELAKGILVKGFCQEVLNLIHDKTLQKTMAAALEEGFYTKAE